jgi:hypothetical protein
VRIVFGGLELYNEQRTDARTMKREEDVKQEMEIE